MSRQLERLLELDRLIRSSQRCTADSLAEALERNERTIRNDIAFLRDRYGAPVKFSRKKGWHYTHKDWRLPSINLDKGELFALTLGARMLEAYAGSTYALELRSAIEQLAKRLPDQTWVDLQQLADERILFRAGAETDLDPEIWHDLETATRQNRTVEMTYYTASSNSVSDRKLDPYLIHIYRGTNPYVIGFCRRRQAIRWFRVDRIQKLEVLSETFTRDPDFDPQDHLKLIFQHEVGSKPVDVAIWFDGRTAPYIRERRWHPTQKLDEHQDGSVTLSMTVSGLNDLKRWVLGYGEGAVVLKPPELLALVQQELKGMLNRYQST
ncbi:helix-turn-helix transcriptional regulator [Acaryochloris marina]|uniref:helix-turn-helix transcriptional regulator n=1 Tax=Acaryochloris marina TaxID=155978 RepID=UPI0021C2AEBF|nr:transcriptional regulator [Acaryochloris marina]BDM82861.1 transcriptional regulator [Acaryochloris marina MBIC10699]